MNEGNGPSVFLVLLLKIATSELICSGFKCIWSYVTNLDICFPLSFGKYSAMVIPNKTQHTPDNPYKVIRF